MLRSFASCMWAMIWSFILLYLLLFLGALIFAQGVGEGLALQLFEGDELSEVNAHFGSVSQTMLSLYMSVTGGNDWIVYFDIVQKTGGSCSLRAKTGIYQTQTRLHITIYTVDCVNIKV